MNITIRSIPAALTLSLCLSLPLSCAEAPDTAAPGAEAKGAPAADQTSALALRIEQAERKLDTGRDIPAARAALAEVLADPAATAPQRYQAKLAMSRVLEAEGDREAATAAVEALLAEQSDGRTFPLAEAARRRLRVLVTGSEQMRVEAVGEPLQASPFARALTRYYPAPEVGQKDISLDVFSFGGSQSVSERLGTFALGPALREARREACPRCDEGLSINASSSQTDWTGIPGARARLGGSLTVFYFDLGSGRIPARYDAELPLPAAEIEARLAKGEGLIAARERSGAPPAILIAAPRKAQLPAVEKALAAMKAVPTEPVAVPLGNSLTTEEIQAVVRGAFPTFRACYEGLLAQSPAAAGSLPLKFTVRADGSVADAQIDATAATLHHAAMEQCMVTATSALLFPAVPNGHTTVTYPIAFSPGE